MAPATAALGGWGRPIRNPNLRCAGAKGRSSSASPGSGRLGRAGISWAQTMFRRGILACARQLVDCQSPRIENQRGIDRAAGLAGEVKGRNPFEHMLLEVDIELESEVTKRTWWGWRMSVGRRTACLRLAIGTRGGTAQIGSAMPRPTIKKEIIPRDARRGVHLWLLSHFRSPTGNPIVSVGRGISKHAKVARAHDCISVRKRVKREPGSHWARPSISGTHPRHESFARACKVVDGPVWTRSHDAWMTSEEIGPDSDVIRGNVVYNNVGSGCQLV